MPNALTPNQIDIMKRVRERVSLWVELPVIDRLRDEIDLLCRLEILVSELPYGYKLTELGLAYLRRVEAR